MPRIGWRELGGVVVASVALVAILSALTEPMPRPDLYDGKAYLRMAEQGFYGTVERGVAAPFAYRPAVPWLAQQVSLLLAVPLPTAFRILALFAAALNLCLVYGFSRAVGARRGLAGLVVLLMALSHFQVRGPLYFYTLIDIETQAVLLVATWALWERQWFPALAISWVGLFFKEWLLVPAGVAWVQMARACLRSRSLRETVWVLAAAVATALLFLGPRQWVPVTESFSSLDGIRDLDSLLAVTIAPQRWANILYAAASFWLPTLMLLTPQRIRGLSRALQGHGFWMGLYAAGVLLLTLFGGTNIMIFVTYSLPLQVIVLSRIAKAQLPAAEIVLLVVAIAIFNKVAIPLPELDATIAGRNRWLDFYGGWADRLNETTALRSLWMLLFILLANGLRAILGRRAAA